MKQTIIRIIAKELGVPEGSVVAEASIQEELAADSLDSVCLILSLEESFGISISDEEASMLKTVNDVLSTVEKKCRIAWFSHIKLSVHPHS